MTRMETILRPEHVGEPLVATLMREIEQRNGLSAITCYNPSTGVPTSLAALLAGAGLAAPLFLHHRVELERPVFRGIQFGLDGEHKLDCLITDGNTGMAIEVKLGIGRLAAETFERRFLKDCCRSNHGDVRLRGNMIALLDGRLGDLSTATALLSARIQGGEAVTIASKWLLVVRESVWSAWKAGRAPALRDANVVVMEELVPLVGGHARFDQIVLELIGSDFAKAWGM